MSKDELDSLFEGSPVPVFKPSSEHPFVLVPRGRGPFREKYRPQKFEELVPTCSIEQLRNQIDNPNASNVFLLVGRSGTGKTTSARTLARAFVCLDNNGYNKPCLECKNCLSFDKSFDVLEQNSADKNKVDDTRHLVSDMRMRPAIFNKKIYILDEVQRLTKDAQQVLLTELEEPHPHLLVFLCTTDITALNKALVDRACKITFSDVSAEHASAIIDQVCQHESIAVADEIKESLFFQAQGSVRSLLNHIQAYAEEGFDPSQMVDDDTPAEVKALFKLIKKGNWPKLSQLLKKPNVRKDSEGLRMGLENYMRVVLLNTSNMSEAALIGNALIRISGSLLTEPSSTSMYNQFILKCLRACVVFNTV
jgi:DNA polymerase III subunit gamma/tau